MNTKKLIIETVGKDVLGLIVGYGVNQRGACSRDGGLTSFDYYGSKDEVEQHIKDTTNCGYGNTLGSGATKVTIWNEIDSRIEGEREHFQTFGYGELLEEDIIKICKEVINYWLPEIQKRFK